MFPECLLGANSGLHAVKISFLYFLVSLKLNEAETEARRGQISCWTSHSGGGRLQTHVGLALTQMLFLEP